MSNRELCLEIIDSFEEEQLKNIVVLLNSIKEMVAEAADDAFCMQLVNEFNEDPDPDKSDTMSIQEFSKELEIILG